jgi:hypothetical protein
MSKDTRNIIILKNLPSNLIDEAIIVVKDKKKLKEFNYTDMLNCKENNGIIQGEIKNDIIRKIESMRKEQKNYIVKEAEVVVNSYIQKIEENLAYKKTDKIKKSYKKLKKLNFALIITTLISILLAIFM